MKSYPQSVVAIVCITITAFAATRAVAEENDPPSRVARLADIEGSVSFQPAGTDAWVAPPINRPLTTGDQLWSDENSRAELQLDGSLLRLAANTSVSLLNLSDNVTQIQLSSGTLLLRVRRLDDNETYEVDTPNLAFTALRPGLYRISVDPSGNSTAVLIRRGQGEVTGGGSAYSLADGEYDVFSGTDELSENTQGNLPNQDAFDAWSAARDVRSEHSVSARYVSSDVVGYEDLDEQGTWTPDPEYGNVWYPRGVAAGWAPYHNGHWAYVAPWGYTWVDASTWGFAPFHYGRWVSVRGAWGWIPAPPRRPNVPYVRPVYAPALVAWVGVGAGVAWFALGPREVYVPSYAVSPRYVRNINISNTNVNTTVINNVYNTTIINKTVENNITYVNRHVPGAVAATTSQAFAGAQPVDRNAFRVDQHTLARASVAPLAPAAVPTRQAFIGSGRVTTLRPPAAVRDRVVVARTTPPVAPPSFDRRQEAIRNNGGKPLSVAQVQQVTASAPPREAVRIAPAARMMSPSHPTAAANPPAGPAANTRPVERPLPQSMPSAVHPSEMPPLRQPASPSIANSVMERQHLQEQQHEQARQNEERQRLQQQQQAEHDQAAKVTADRTRQQQIEQQRQTQAQVSAQQHPPEQQQQQARQQQMEQQHQAQAQAMAQQRAQEQKQQEGRQQQLEQRHQAQTQAQAQQHAQELQKLEVRQQEQRKQQEAVPPQNARKPDNPPPPKQ
ncbi:MAG: DUF6600 domain-containing protein [Steroidobacteraceae bacterium]